MKTDVPCMKSLKLDVLLDTILTEKESRYYLADAKYLSMPIKCQTRQTKMPNFAEERWESWSLERLEIMLILDI